MEINENIVLNYIKKMVPSQVINIENSQNKDFFIEIAKKWIDAGNTDYEFNSDLSKFRRIKFSKVVAKHRI